jgi:hypothetical protein
MKNKSILIMDKDHSLNANLSLSDKLMHSVHKIIVVDGDNYNVIKSRHGEATQNGHISSLKKELDQ